MLIIYQIVAEIIKEVAERLMKEKLLKMFGNLSEVKVRLNKRRLKRAELRKKDQHKDLLHLPEETIKKM